jgi:L-asparaginase/Glu-tRNA(Gln) amidotransferase subunit D
VGAIDVGLAVQPDASGLVIDAWGSGHDHSGAVAAMRSTTSHHLRLEVRGFVMVERAEQGPCRALG